MCHGFFDIYEIPDASALPDKLPDNCVKLLTSDDSLAFSRKRDRITVLQTGGSRGLTGDPPYYSENSFRPKTIFRDRPREIANQRRSEGALAGEVLDIPIDISAETDTLLVLILRWSELELRQPK